MYLYNEHLLFTIEVFWFYVLDNNIHVKFHDLFNYILTISESNHCFSFPLFHGKHNAFAKIVCFWRTLSERERERERLAPYEIGWILLLDYSTWYRTPHQKTTHLLQQFIKSKLIAWKTHWPDISQKAN